MSQIDFVTFYNLGLCMYIFFFLVLSFGYAYFFPIVVSWNKIFLKMVDLSYIKVFLFYNFLFIARKDYLKKIINNDIG